MSAQTLGILRDLSALLLCLECALFLAVPLVVLFFAQKYLRIGRKWLRAPLLRVQVIALRAQNVTMRATSALARVPIAARSAATRVRVTANAFVKGAPKSPSKEA
jgi:hypothetical protein